MRLDFLRNEPQFLHHNYRHILEKRRYFIFREITEQVFFNLRMIDQILINEDRRALTTYPKCTFFLNIAKAKTCRNLHFVGPTFQILEQNWTTDLRKLRDLQHENN